MCDFSRTVGYSESKCRVPTENGCGKVMEFVELTKKGFITIRMLDAR